MIFELSDRLTFKVVFYYICELMTKSFLYAFLYVGLLINEAFAEVEVVFTPSYECENKIVDLIDHSKTSIDVAVYSINNSQIVAALKLAKQRNVTIRILTDRLQAAGKYSMVTDLHDTGLNIRVHSKNKIEHNKFAIFDGETVSTGSYNWTNAASEKNSENCLFLIKEPEHVRSYQMRFEELWSANSQEKSERWFENRRIKHETNN